MSARQTVTPALLPPNLVWRSYAGGRELRRFRSLPGAGDDHFPEDWLASTVYARNGKNSQHPREGLSCIMEANQERLFADALGQEPEHWFGPASAGRGWDRSMPVLWKLLDASVRLQFQAHPDARFAREHLGSHHGKTECWYIFSTRGDACVYLGFQRPPTRQAWKRMIGEQRVEEMLSCFEEIPVQAGDCYVVPAGTPHAIGAGVFMVELMEPTDWVVRCETVNAGVTLSPEACFMGLGLEACLDIFDYRAYPVSDVRRRFQQTPRAVAEAGINNYIEEEIIGTDWHKFFRLHRLRGDGDASWPGKELMLAIVVGGKGGLSADGRPQMTGAGQTWLLPGSAQSWRWHNYGGAWEILLLKLPLA
jgi:mannose-6-phosphate isomerase